MAGIPLPALAVKGPDPGQMTNAFMDVARLRAAEAAQQQNAANEQQRNAILQQQANQQQQAEQFRQQQILRQYAISQQMSKLIGQSIGQDGKIDYNKMQSLFSNSGFGTYYGPVATSLQKVEEGNEKIKSAVMANADTQVAFGSALRGLVAGMPHTDATMNWMIGTLKNYDPAQADTLAQEYKRNPSAVWDAIDRAHTPSNPNIEWLSLAAQEKNPDGTPTPEAIRAQNAANLLESTLSKTRPPKQISARDTQTGAIVFVTPQDIQNSPGRYVPVDKPNFAEIYPAISGARALEKPTAEWLQFNANAQAALQNLDNATTGSQLAASLGPLQTALIVTGAGGVHRINMTEVNAAGGSAMGSIARRVDAALQRAGSGALPKQTINEMKQLIQMYTQQKYRQYVNDVQANAINFGLNPDKVAVASMNGTGAITLSQATKTLAHPSTHQFSISAWRRANPGVKVSDAEVIEQAKKAGYQVVP